MKFNYIVISCTKEDNKKVEFPILFPISMNGFEVEEALRKSQEVFEIYKHNELVSYGIVYISANGVKCEGQPEKLINMFSGCLEGQEIVKILKSRNEIDEKLISSFN